MTSLLLIEDLINFQGCTNGFTSVYLWFFLYISNTNNMEDGILCHHDTTYTKHTIPDYVSINCPYSGQFVIYYNKRLPEVKYPPGYSDKAFADLCEVQVFGMSFESFIPWTVFLLYILFNTRLPDNLWIFKVALVQLQMSRNAQNHVPQTVKNVILAQGFVLNVNLDSMASIVILVSIIFFLLLYKR